MTEAEARIAEELRIADPDRYLSVLYAPEGRRPDLFALYAFNAEIAAVRDRIHEPLPGEVRLQWWRDVIAAGTVEAAGGHPLAAALIRAIDTHHLPQAAFQACLDARVFDLYDDPMPSRGDLEGYLGETASVLIQLAALILDRDAATAISEAAGHAGCARGIAGLLQLVPQHRARGQCFVPRDLLASAGTTPEAFVTGSDRPAATRALEAMVALGREHWTAYRQSGPVPPSLRPAFQPVATAPDILGAAERAGAEALDTPARVSPMRRFWRVFRSGVALRAR